MKRQWSAVVLAAGTAFLLVACKAREESSPPAPAPAVVPAAPSVSVTPAPEASTTQRPLVSTGPKGTPPPAVATKAAPPPDVASAPEVADPGGEVAVPPARAGLTRVGAEKCKVCHKVQYASWATSGHAKRKPSLDCEGCHGPGSEYRSLAVMKDPAKAQAAGLVRADASFCGKCHKGKPDPGLLRKVHAHKAV